MGPFVSTMLLLITFCWTSLGAREGPLPRPHDVRHWDWPITLRAYSLALQPSRPNEHSPALTAETKHVYSTQHSCLRLTSRLDESATVPDPAA